jgi:crotonobetainyl-CoA:carnitine CoA-transferase CaiB-like acyl-CoA transferase
VSGGPLEGVRILDLTRLLPGGYGLSLLADLGAEVVKVEEPGTGDYMRWAEPRLGSESAASWVTDRNKRSISLNLKDPRGVEAFGRLVERFDAVVEGFRPGVVDRLGIGYEALRRRNPRIVFCSISGYGQTGPLARAAGHDINYVGRAGILSITGPADGDPAVPGVQVGDLAGGALLAMVGLLTALLRARETGEGDHVDVAMTDGCFSLLSVHLGDFFAGGVPPGREDMLLNGRYPAYCVHRCADGRHLTVGALEPQFFSVLCEGVGRPDLVDTAFQVEALPVWRELFASRTRDEWLETLDGPDTCVGPVNDFAEACADPQIRHREMLVELVHPDLGRVQQVGTPIKLRNRPGAVTAAGPRLGQQTRAYLDEAGYDEAEIDALVADGVAATPD